jgi:AcrR family transcriptional regulator
VPTTDTAKATAAPHTHRTPTGRRGTRHAPAEQRRGQILEAAMSCFADKGYERTTMDDVAGRSGLSKGSLYRFFPSKDDLLLGVFDNFEAMIEAVLDQGPDDPVLVRLERTGRFTVAEVAAHPELSGAWLEFLGHPSSRERLRALYDRSRRKLASMVRKGTRTGELRKLAPEAAAATVLGALEGLMLQALVDPDFDVARRWPGIWDVIEAGLRAGPTSSRPRKAKE